MLDYLVGKVIDKVGYIGKEDDVCILFTDGDFLIVKIETKENKK